MKLKLSIQLLITFLILFTDLIENAEKGILTLLDDHAKLHASSEEMSAETVHKKWENSDILIKKRQSSSTEFTIMCVM